MVRVKKRSRIEIHLPKIKAGLENLENALEPYRNTLNELQNIKTDEIIAKKEFIATYVSTYGAVVQVMGSKKQSESFFKRSRSKNNYFPHPLPRFFLLQATK